MFQEAGSITWITCEVWLNIVLYMLQNLLSSFINRQPSIKQLTSGVFKQNLVVQPQSQLGHSRQENTHFNGANNFTAQHITIGTDLNEKVRQKGKSVDKVPAGQKETKTPIKKC